MNDSMTAIEQTMDESVQMLIKLRVRLGSTFTEEKLVALEPSFGKGQPRHAVLYWAMNKRVIRKDGSDAFGRRLYEFIDTLQSAFATSPSPSLPSASLEVIGGGALAEGRQKGKSLGQETYEQLKRTAIQMLLAKERDLGESFWDKAACKLYPSFGLGGEHAQVLRWGVEEGVLDQFKEGRYRFLRPGIQRFLGESGASVPDEPEEVDNAGDEQDEQEEGSEKDESATHRAGWCGDEDDKKEEEEQEMNDQSKPLKGLTSREQGRRNMMALCVETHGERFKPLRLSKEKVKKGNYSSHQSLLLALRNQATKRCYVAEVPGGNDWEFEWRPEFLADGELKRRLAEKRRQNVDLPSSMSPSAPDTIPDLEEGSPDLGSPSSGEDPAPESSSDRAVPESSGNADADQRPVENPHPAPEPPAAAAPLATTADQDERTQVLFVQRKALEDQRAGIDREIAEVNAKIKAIQEEQRQARLATARAVLNELSEEDRQTLLRDFVSAKRPRPEIEPPGSL